MLQSTQELTAQVHFWDQLIETESNNNNAQVIERLVRERAWAKILLEEQRLRDQGRFS